MNLEFAHLIPIILLPMVPAFVLFWKLPSTADVTGPLQGLNLKLSGAFGGYCALLIILLYTHNIWNPPPSRQVWEVRGTVADEAGTAVRALTPTDIGLMPVRNVAYPDGTFSLTVSTEPKDGGGIAFPKVVVGYQDFQPVTIPLDPSDGSHQGLIWDEKAHVVTIPTIRLKKFPEYNNRADTDSGNNMIATKGAQP